MQENISFKMVAVAISLFCSAAASADCTGLPVQGTIQTQSIDATHQVGVITMTSVTNPLLFKRLIGRGQVIIRGGISGEITENLGYEIHLEHHMGFPNIGSIDSFNDVATVTGAPDEYGNVPVVEVAPLNAAVAPFGGVFNGFTFDDAIATGTVGTLSGTNVFVYTACAHRVP